MEQTRRFAPPFVGYMPDGVFRPCGRDSSAPSLSLRLGWQSVLGQQFRKSPIPDKRGRSDAAQSNGRPTEEGWRSGTHNTHHTTTDIDVAVRRMIDVPVHGAGVILRVEPRPATQDAFDAPLMNVFASVVASMVTARLIYFFFGTAFTKAVRQSRSRWRTRSASSFCSCVVSTVM